MKKVLIIEDDSSTLELLGIIAEDSGIEAVLKTDVISLAEIETINPDLILLDHWIGHQSGGDLCLAIKQNPATQKIAIVLLSGNSNIGQIAMDSGAAGSLNKPFDIEEVETIFAAYLV